MSPPYSRDDFIEELGDLAALRPGRLTAQKQRRIYGRQVDKYPLTDDARLDKMLDKLYSFRVAAHNFLFNSDEARREGKIDDATHRRRLVIAEYYIDELVEDIRTYTGGRPTTKGAPAEPPKNVKGVRAT